MREDLEWSQHAMQTQHYPSTLAGPRYRIMKELPQIDEVCASEDAAEKSSIGAANKRVNRILRLMIFVQKSSSLVSLRCLA